MSKIKNNGVKMVLQELATGLTFAQLARDSEKRGEWKGADRQKAAAQEAYQTVMKFLPEVTPTASQKSQIEADLAELESKLKTLGVGGLT